MSSTRGVGTAALGVVLPVHNEEALLPAALESLGLALGQLESSVMAAVCVVLDSCTDRSEELTREWQREGKGDRWPFGIEALTTSQRNVGAARALGCAVLLERWRHVATSRIWLATTDADSRVPRDWLLEQRRAHEDGVDLWSGRVAIVEAPSERAATVAQWRRDYEAEIQPIHGTSLGFSAAAYRAAGGFEPLATGEDRALRQSIVALGGKVQYDSAVRVVTSARRDARSPLGFAHALDVIESTLPSRSQR